MQSESMRVKHPLARRIRLLFTAFTAVICLCFAAMILGYAFLIEDNIFNRMLRQEAAHMEQTYLVRGIVPKPRYPFMQLHTGWEALPDAVLDAHQRDAQRIEFILDNGDTLHAKSLWLGSDEYVLSADVNAFEVSTDYLATISRWLVIAILVICLLALLLASAVSRLTVRPVVKLANEVQRFDPKAEQQKRPVVPSDYAANEIGLLASRIAQTFERIQAALARESAFTRDVGHEIRTPVSVLGMLGQRLGETGNLSDKELRQHEQALQQLAQSTTILLALAREASLQQERLGLLGEIEHCIVNNGRLAMMPELDIQLDVDACFKLTCNRHLLHTLLNNLLENACIHGQANSLSIVLSDNTLAFSNALCTDDDEDKQGLGIGLTLVKRIAQRHNWQVKTLRQAGQFSVMIAFS